MWFRRDLRAEDHAALHHALRQARAVHCVFVFDTDILDALPSRADRRVEFIWHSVRELDQALQKHGGGLLVLHGEARSEIPRLAATLKAGAVFANEDYEPDAVARDAAVQAALAGHGIDFIAGKDQVIFAKSEVLTQDGRPFSVFTPYKNAWLKRLTDANLQPHAVAPAKGQLAVVAGHALPSLEALGFEKTNLLELGIKPGVSGADALFADFKRRMAAYRAPRFSGVKRAELPVGASAFRHDLDPRARGGGLA